MTGQEMIEKLLEGIQLLEKSQGMMMKTMASLVERSEAADKRYIGLTKDGRTNNFVLCIPKKGHCTLDLRLPQTEALDSRLEEAGLDLLDYSTRRGRYRIRLREDSLKQHKDLITELFNAAYQRGTQT